MVTVCVYSCFFPSNTINAAQKTAIIHLQNTSGYHLVLREIIEHLSVRHTCKVFLSATPQTAIQCQLGVKMCDLQNYPHQKAQKLTKHRKEEP